MTTMALLIVLFGVVASVSAEFHTCNTWLRGSQGTVDSHRSYGYSNYGNNYDCDWYIVNEGSTGIQLQTVAFETEGNQNGCEDILWIAHSKKSTGAWTDYEQYCGSNGPNIRFTDVSTIILSFRANNVNGKRGFRLKWAPLGSNPPPPPPTIPTPPPTIRPPVFTTTRRPSTGSCGVPAITPKPGNNRQLDGFRIVGGTEATPGSWPWMAGLLNNGFQGCGATLIHPQWVVSAAHCFGRSTNPRDYKIALDMHTPSNSGQTIQVSKVFKHEGYNPANTDNDITLLKLERPAKLNSRVGLACLPNTDVQPGHNCFVTGWGKTEGTSSHGRLKQAMVPIIGRDTCRKYPKYGIVTDNMICAGYNQGGIDSCQGDSGGPFVCNVNGKFELQGIVSWGFGCADPSNPGVYTRVTKYLSWIKQKMAAN